MSRVSSIIAGAVVVIAGFARAAEPMGPDYSDRDNLSRSDFRRQNLKDATFERSRLEYTLFSESDLTGAKFRKSRCTGCSFNQTKLVGADFSKADLSFSGFSEADLSKAVLDDAKLEQVSLYGAKLIGASLKNTKGVTNITKADFTDADLRGCDFSFAKDYGPNSAIFKGAKYNMGTVFPAGVLPERVGAVLVKDDLAATNPLPQADPAVLMNTGKLFYAGVAKPDAVKLAEHLEEKHGYGNAQELLKLTKEGNVYHLRINGVVLDDGELEISDKHKKLAKDLATFYAGAETEVHLCKSLFHSEAIVKGDGSIKDLRAKPAKTEPNPSAKPDPKPDPNPSAKPDPKPDPKSPATESEFGVELKFDKAQLFFTKTMTREDASKLGDYLSKELGFGERPMKLQVHKDGGTIQLRMVIEKAMLNDPDFLRDCRELGLAVSKNVFPRSPVEVHLCNEAFKSLRVIRPN